MDRFRNSVCLALALAASSARPVAPRIASLTECRPFADDLAGGGANVKSMTSPQTIGVIGGGTMGTA